MKLKKVLFILIGLLFLATFFLKIIPIPVENIAGVEDPENFVFGGFYWTSGIYELVNYNYIGSLSYMFIFLFLTGGVYLLKI